MTVVDIYIYDSAEEEHNEMLASLGLPEKEPKMILVPFYFNENLLAGFWINLDTNDETGSTDIMFYIGGRMLRTPYTDQKFILFKNLIQ